MHNGNKIIDPQEVIHIFNVHFINYDLAKNKNL